MKPDTSKTLPARGAPATRIAVNVTLDYDVMGAAEVLLRIGAEPYPGQTVVSHGYVSPTTLDIRDAPSALAWAHAENHFHCTYQAEVEITRPDIDLTTLAATPVRDLPDDLLRYLTASRYCPSDEFIRFVGGAFGTTTGGARVQAIVDWVSESLVYQSGISNVHTTATDTFVERAGVCRDYAHLVITLARASCIPARIASVYGTQVSPQDFHAVVEVYLDGAWHFVDATGMAKPSQIAKICDGRDAADIAFLTTFGAPAYLTGQSVQVSVI